MNNVIDLEEAYRVAKEIKFHRVSERRPTTNSVCLIRKRGVSAEATPFSITNMSIGAEPGVENVCMFYAIGIATFDGMWRLNSGQDRYNGLTYQYENLEYLELDLLDSI